MLSIGGEGSAVVAMVDLPVGAQSPPLRGRLDLTRAVEEVSDVRYTFYVTLARGCKLVSSESEDEAAWMPHAQWARDCHSQNLQILVVDGLVYFRALRPVRRGEELFVWFVQEMVKELGIPFLTPRNIQGQQRYVCDICNRTFRDPNPLKIHLTFQCSRETPRHPLLPPSLLHIPPRTPLRPSPLYPQSPRPPVVMATARFPRLSIDEWRRMMVPPTPPTFTTPPSILKSTTTCTTRRGHQCIYCGKMYSRKYGLKIHIRTHTGYKPLKCRVCLRPFGDPSNLNKHVRLHAQGNTPYRCELCGKVLVRRRDLERHLKSRHPTESAASGGEGVVASGSGVKQIKDETVPGK